GDEVTVLAHFDALQRHGSISSELVGINEYGHRRIERRERVEHTLVLQSVVLADEIALALLEWNAISLKVPQAREPGLDAVARRNPLQIAEGDLVLIIDPVLELRRVEILHPAVGVGDLGAVVIIDLVNLARLGIARRLSRFG